MSRIEGMLRETFRERVATGPAVEAIAERAIAGGSRRRRGRTALATGAAALCVAVAGIAVVSYPHAPAPPSGPSATWRPTELVRELPVDVVVDRYVYLAGGGVVSLAPVLPARCDGGACIRGVWRVLDGHLVSVHDADAAVGASVLWHVPDAGPATVVVDGGGALVVSAGTTQRPGIQVVWVDDGRLHAGTYGAGEVSEVASTPAPKVELAELTPRAVVGDAVVLSGPGAAVGGTIRDVWFPDRGDYRPAAYPAIGLHGTTVDGERIIGWFWSEDDRQTRCLAELAPEEFAPLRSVCPSPFTSDARIHPSPDGRWWIVADWSRATADVPAQRGLALYDSEQVWHGVGPVRTWFDAGSSFDGTWLDGETFAAIDRSPGTVLTLHLDGRPDDTLRLPTPGPTAQVSVVPDLRSTPAR